MRKKKGGGGGGGANWMDTYGDMVTLLLCFFVLLYSMSTLDQQKWLLLVQSFNPDAIPQVTEMMGNDGPVSDPVTGDTMEQQREIESMIQELFEQLQEYVEQQDAAQNISVTMGDGYVFISLDDAVFFDGDSYVLRREGQEVLSDVGAMLESAKDAIDEIRILGHTAQATATDPNDTTVDRFLSSNRATVVLIYLQKNTTLDPARLVSQGYGQWRPIASNAVASERARNRRVELIVTGKNLVDGLSGSITEYYTARGTEMPASLQEGLADSDAAPPADQPGLGTDTAPAEPVDSAMTS